MKLERIVKTFYDSLEEGKIMGRRCKRCGAVEFPPVLCCNSCSGTEMEWVEMSGKAKMTDFVLPGILSAKPENEDLMPYSLACVELEEGPRFNTIVCGVARRNKAKLLNELPVPVKARIVQRNGYKIVIFDLAVE
jgi:hypothetical protein